MLPYCFVIMPFGRKRDESGREIDFDRVYWEIIHPGITAAELEPIRADEETLGGIIHKQMFERLMLCDYAVADLTTANANVFYELGIRHAARPHSTVLMFADGLRLPFDVAALRGVPYGLSTDGIPAEVERDSAALAVRLRACRDPVDDSPLYQFVQNWPRPKIERLRTDTFRDQIVYAEGYKCRLRVAREARDEEAITMIEAELSISDADPAIVIDIFLSYRAVDAWDQMVKLAEAMPAPLCRTVMVQEQLGFALNRLARRNKAEQVLCALIDTHGPSSETNGLLGRVYKDLWEDAKISGNNTRAKGFLRKAISTYLAGFEADWRDAYPGINAVTLMEMSIPVDPRQQQLLTVVQYAVERRLVGRTSDYWDHATQLELAILARDQTTAEDALANALIAIQEPWEPATTARNLRLIREARMARNEDVAWIKVIEQELK